ncbi:hypothetical protein [Pseudomonas aeruginosa]|uniref:hypothetical protein n=1 Tax=Pseudomonas aeruginosa TaxID=287 RepID=UPI00106B580C|nr:hypothetical protein [Pseudomonas aeruginosa]
MEFKCIGFDIRLPESLDNISADATAWPQDTQLYERALSSLKLQENALQLIQIDTQEQLAELQGIIKAEGNDSVLLSMEVYSEVIDALKLSRFRDFNSTQASIASWTELGLDVCDINGYFSILKMETSISQERLIPPKEIEKAHAICEAANILVKEHAPFVTIKLRYYPGSA